MAAGGDHTCAIRADSSLECWGRTKDDRPDASAGGFVSVSGGGHHSCDVRADNTAACWGDLGQADASAGGFVWVSGGGHHSCGPRTDGTVECRGNDRHGKSQPSTAAFGP